MMSPTTPLLPLHPCLSMSFPLPLPLLYCNTRSCSVLGHYFRIGSQHQIFVMKASGFENLWLFTGQQQLHTYRVSQSECLTKSSDRRVRGRYQKPRSKHKNGSVLHMFQQNVILTLIISLPEEVASYTHMQAGMLKHTHTCLFNKLGSGPPEDQHYCLSAGPIFYELWSPVYWLFTSSSVDG